MSSANLTVVPIEVFLGYDPWTFFRMVHVKQNLAYLMFGWCTYEAMECFGILFNARRKWKTLLFQALAWSFSLQAVASAMSSIGYGNPEEVAGDLFAGPAEYIWVVTVTLINMAAKWAYFAATVSMTLAVFPNNKYVRISVWIVTVQAVLACIAYLISVSVLYQLEYEQHVLYMQTYDVYAVLGRMKAVILPYLPTTSICLEIETAAILVFMLLTKLPFLYEIFKMLGVPLATAVKTMASTRSTRRIVFSSCWSIIEAIIVARFSIVDVTIAISMFVGLFQVNTLSMLAFEGSATIVKQHSMASSRTTQDSKTAKLTRVVVLEAKVSGEKNSQNGQPIL